MRRQPTRDQSRVGTPADPNGDVYSLLDQVGYAIVEFGGYLAPPEFIRELLRNIVAFSPIRSLARVVAITAGAALLPKRTAP